MNDDNEDKSVEEHINNRQDKIEKKGIKVIAVRSRLKVLLPGFGMAISIISLILIKLMSVFFPTPITRQAEDGTWYTDFIGYIDYHNLYGVINVVIYLFMLSFTVLIFFLFWKKSKSSKKILFTLIGYVMVMVFCIKSLYEPNTKPFIAMNFLEIVVSIIYIACAILLLFFGSEKLKVNNRR